MVACIDPGGAYTLFVVPPVFYKDHLTKWIRRRGGGDSQSIWYNLSAANEGESQPGGLTKLQARTTPHSLSRNMIINIRPVYRPAMSVADFQAPSSGSSADDDMNRRYTWGGG